MSTGMFIFEALYHQYNPSIFIRICNIDNVEKAIAKKGRDKGDARTRPLNAQLRFLIDVRHVRKLPTIFRKNQCHQLLK